MYISVRVEEGREWDTKEFAGVVYNLFILQGVRNTKVGDVQSLSRAFDLDESREDRESGGVDPGRWGDSCGDRRCLEWLNQNLTLGLQFARGLTVFSSFRFFEIGWSASFSCSLALVAFFGDLPFSRDINASTPKK